MTGTHRGAIQKLLVELGAACSAYQDKVFRNLNVRVQCDEIWSSVSYAKDKNVLEEMRNQPGIGSVWTLVALDPDTKLVPCWFVSSRDAGAANHFMHDLAGRLAHRVQLTTDGHKPYLTAVEDAFGSEIDYAMLVKIYGAERAGEARYSPAQCMGARMAVISGTPDRAHISSSHTERQNLTMRMQMRRFTRLTNAFSKKIENHEAAIALLKCATILPSFIRPCASRQRWKREFQIMFGDWKKLWICCLDFNALEAHVSVSPHLA